MNRLGGSIRLAAIVTLVVGAMPLQMISNLCRWKLARTLPVTVHRITTRILGIRIRIAGLPPGRKPTLVVSNHVSWLDIVVISSVQPFSFIAKAEVERWPIFGLLAKLQNSVFIDRQRRVATAEANDAIARRLSAGDAMILFAEGTTGDGNRLLPFRSSLVGAAQAALQGQDSNQACPVEIKPLAISYTHRHGLPITRRDRPKIAWYGDMDLVPHFWAFLREGAVDVTLSWGEPIPLNGDIDRKSVTALVQDIIRATLRQ